MQSTTVKLKNKKLEKKSNFWIGLVYRSQLWKMIQFKMNQTWSWPREHENNKSWPYNYDLWSILIVLTRTVLTMETIKEGKKYIRQENSSALWHGQNCSNHYLPSISPSIHFIFMSLFMIPVPSYLISCRHMWHVHSVIC